MKEKSINELNDIFNSTKEIEKIAECLQCCSGFEKFGSDLFINIADIQLSLGRIINTEIVEHENDLTIELIHERDN